MWLELFCIVFACIVIFHVCCPKTAPSAPSRGIPFTMTLGSTPSDRGRPRPRGARPSRPQHVRPAGSSSPEHGRPTQNRQDSTTTVRGTTRRRHPRVPPPPRTPSPPFPPPEDLVGRLERAHRDLRDMYLRGILNEGAVRDLPNLFRALGLNVQLDVEEILGTRSNDLPD
ncbi:unnamed protein product [Ixodes hexagonus]